MLGIAGGNEWKKDSSGQLEPRRVVGAGLRKGHFGGADGGGGKFRIGGVLIGSGSHNLQAEIFGDDRVTQFQI